MKTSNPLSGFHLRNLLTYLVVVSSISGILALFRNGTVHGAVGVLLCLAIIFDCFDGKFSRLFPNASPLQKEMGGELDSLADFLGFGVFPALIFLYFTGIHLDLYQERSTFIVLASLWYLLCVFHRLAFFNVASGGDRFFTGLPSPLGALVISYAWALNHKLNAPNNSWLMICAYIISGIWMVSSHKIARPQIRGTLFLVFLIGFSALLHLI